MFLNTTVTVSDEKTGEETVLVITLGALALVLAPLTLASNILVLVPFCRFSRVRTASNQILLALAITDLLLGSVMKVLEFHSKTDEVQTSLHLNEHLIDCWKSIQNWRYFYK